DSLLSTVEALTRLERLDFARPCVVPLDWFAGNEAFLDSMVKQTEVEVPTPEDEGTQRLLALQLASHASTEARLARTLLKRAEKKIPTVGAPWHDLLIEAIRKTGAEVDLKNPR